MTNNSQRAGNCGFAENLVAYIYDETTAAEKTAFERHLRECAGCADEVAEFSEISFSIREWKSAEFDRIPTPAISVPYETILPVAETAAVKGSWLSAMRDLFTLSPSWSLATASMAVVAVAVGLVIFSMRGPSANDLAENNKNTRPVIATQTPPSNAVPAASPDEKNIVSPVGPQKTEKAVEPRSADPETRVVRAVSNQRTTPKPAQPKPKDTKRTPKTDDETVPAVDADDEDDSLRLAELFDEIDTD